MRMLMSPTSSRMMPSWSLPRPRRINPGDDCAADAIVLLCLINIKNGLCMMVDGVMV